MTKQRNRGTGNRIGGEGALARIAKAQKGVVSGEQLVEAGVSRRASSHRAQTGRLHRVHRNVYAVGHLAIGELGRHHAAVLACGEGAVVSHLSAAALWGLRIPAPRVIDVIVPVESGRKIDGIRPHRCRYPGDGETTNLDGVPCTTPARTLADLAAVLGRSSLRRAVDQAAVLRLLDREEMRSTLARARGRRGIRVLRATVEPLLGEDGHPARLRSTLEGRLLRAIVGAGLPRPECNAVLSFGGERFEVDFLWAKQRLVVETDGEETHHTPAAFQRDRRRDQVLAAAGYRHARVTWQQMKHERAEVLGRIEGMLRR